MNQDGASMHLTSLTAKVVAAVVSMLVGGSVAAVTVVGLVTHGVDAKSNRPADVTNASVPYGSTK